MLLLQAVCPRKGFPGLAPLFRWAECPWHSPRWYKTPADIQPESWIFWPADTRLQRHSHWPSEHPTCTGICWVSWPLPPPLMAVLPAPPCRQLSHAHVLQSGRGAVEKPGTDTGVHMPVMSSPSPRPSLPCRPGWEGAFSHLPFYFPYVPGLPVFTDTNQESK